MFTLVFSIWRLMGLTDSRVYNVGEAFLLNGTSFILPFGSSGFLVWKEVFGMCMFFLFFFMEFLLLFGEYPNTMQGPWFQVVREFQEILTNLNIWYNVVHYILCNRTATRLVRWASAGLFWRVFNWVYRQIGVARTRVSRYESLLRNFAGKNKAINLDFIIIRTMFCIFLFIRSFESVTNDNIASNWEVNIYFTTFWSETSFTTYLLLF